ncbi:MAG: rod shape-determining protein MreC [Chloroflexi bacterium]|nr:rod shape-determining protein MreC [Chloroflexota bacterium]
MKKLRLRPLILLLVVMGAFLLMILDSLTLLQPVQNVIHTTFRPLTTAIDDSWRSLSDIVGTFQDLRTLRQRNTELETRADRLTVENLQLAEALNENERLRALLDFATIHPTYDYRGGQIIARPLTLGVSPFLDIMEIDLGANHALATGMPVVTDRGLVGRIRTVYSRSSEVLLLTDTSSSINVMTQASRAFGVLHGRSQQSPLMDFIPNDIEIAVGDIVITSGLGGNFPKGLVVGQIIEVIRNDNQMFQQAVVQPTVNFNRLELVLVITNFAPAAEPEPALPDQPTPTPAP